MSEDPLRARIERELVVERTGWAAERVARVGARLQRDTLESARLDTLVIGSEQHDAFIGPGRTVYVGRRLLDRLPHDEAVALVLARELAHHRLAHVPPVPRTVWAALELPFAISLLARVVRTPSHERDADLLGIEICLDAGYDPALCLATFEILEQIAIDEVDVDGVLGAPRTHAPIRDRVEAMRAHVDAVRRGDRFRVVDAIRRERARRTKLALAAAGGAMVAVALVLLRRR